MCVYVCVYALRRRALFMDLVSYWKQFYEPLICLNTIFIYRYIHMYICFFFFVHLLHNVIYTFLMYLLYKFYCIGSISYGFWLSFKILRIQMTYTLLHWNLHTRTQLINAFILQFCKHVHTITHIAIRTTHTYTHIYFSAYYKISHYLQIYNFLATISFLLHFFYFFICFVDR